MTPSVVVMIIVGILLVIASFLITENIFSKESNTKSDLFTVDENYEFSDRELQIIKRKIEDVIANHAKDIIYETNESLSNMANEKTMALGDYAVAVCDEIEKNHKEVMFLYSMLDDKQKEIMNTVKSVDDKKNEVKDIFNQVKAEQVKLEEYTRNNYSEERRQQMQLEQLINRERKIDRPVNPVNAVPNNQINNPDNTVKKEDEKVNIDENSMDGVSNNDTVDGGFAKNDVINNPADNSFDKSVAADDAVGVDDNREDFDDIFAEIDQTDIDFDDVLENDFKEDSNANDIILEMYRGGSTIIQIARELGLGVGEVKLVIDLYKGDAE